MTSRRAALATTGQFVDISRRLALVPSTTVSPTKSINEFIVDWRGVYPSLTELPNFLRSSRQCCAKRKVKTRSDRVVATGQKKKKIPDTDFAARARGGRNMAGPPTGFSVSSLSTLEIIRARVPSGSRTIADAEKKTPPGSDPDTRRLAPQIKVNAAAPSSSDYPEADLSVAGVRHAISCRFVVINKKICMFFRRFHFFFWFPSSTSHRHQPFAQPLLCAVCSPSVRGLLFVHLDFGCKGLGTQVEASFR